MGLKQLNFDLLNKTEVAIQRLKQHEPPDGYYLGFSGGKDSIVIYDIAVKAGVKFDAHYNVSPIDPPEIKKFIKEHYLDVAWDNHAKDFWKQFQSHGAPMRTNRWCCRLIKEIGGIGRVKVLGMRRSESIGRRKYSVYKKHERSENTYWLLPIIDWCEGEVWEYIDENKLLYCSLYDEGFHRLGCVLCPYESAQISQLMIERFPKIARAWRIAFERYHQKRIERGTPLSFINSEEYWQWWISRKGTNQNVNSPQLKLVYLNE